MNDESFLNKMLHVYASIKLMNTFCFRISISRSKVLARKTVISWHRMHWIANFPPLHLSDGKISGKKSGDHLQQGGML